MTRKKLFEVIVPVERASGTRYYRIRADSLEEAMHIYQAGDAECKEEQLEAETLGEPEFTEIEE